jgi:hypothetical protein
VIVAPLDFVPGLVVLDGQPSRAMTRLPTEGGPAFPGPDDRHWWAGERTCDHGHVARMDLVDLDGRPVGPSIARPGFPASGDGTGKLVYITATGTYLESPTGRSLITTGTVLAIGPTRWLTIEHRGQGCELVTTDRATGARRALHAVDCLKDDTYFPGVVSPDGTTAAAVEGFATGTEALHVIDLASGADQVLGVQPLYADGSNGHLVWSPDSRSLWFVTQQGEVDIVDGHGSHLRRLPLDLPPVAQLAFRITAGR